MIDVFETRWAKGPGNLPFPNDCEKLKEWCKEFFYLGYTEGYDDCDAMQKLMGK